MYLKAWYFLAPEGTMPKLTDVIANSDILVMPFSQITQIHNLIPPHSMFAECHGVAQLTKSQSPSATTPTSSKLPLAAPTIFISKVSRFDNG